MTTCGCGAPTGDGTTLCRACTTRLAADLDQVTWLERELTTVLARQAVYGDRAGGRSAEHPLPYDPRASEAAWVLRDTLTNVARALGPQPPANRPESAGDATKPSGWADPLGTGVSAARIARSLAQRLDTIRRHPEAYLLADEVHAAVTQARRVIDRPPARVYVGHCPCHTDLYARPGAASVRCTGCGTTYDVAQRRAELLEAAHDRLATATEIARLLKALGLDVSASRIRGYAHRGRLTPRGRNHEDDPLYRVGDVLDLITEKAPPTRSDTPRQPVIATRSANAKM